MYKHTHTHIYILYIYKCTSSQALIAKWNEFIQCDYWDICISKWFFKCIYLCGALNVALAWWHHPHLYMPCSAVLVLLLPSVERDFLVGLVRPSILDTYCEFEGSGRSVIHAISSWLSSAVAKAISPKTLAAAISKAIKGSPCLKATVPHKDSLRRDRGKKGGRGV